MIVLPNMGLVKWDQIGDYFSHQQLAANFDAIDAHDHTPGKGKRIPAGALAPLSVGPANLQDGAFVTEKIADGSISTVLLQDESITLGKLTAALAESLIPVGSLIATASSTAATGFLMADASAVSRITYVNLFDEIGTTYGTGDGSTTFNLPDYRGRVLVGKGTHTDVNALTDNDGLAVASRTPKHLHDKGTLAMGGPSSGVGDAAGSGLYGLADNTHVHTMSGNTGTNSAAYAVVNVMIKT